MQSTIPFAAAMALLLGAASIPAQISAYHEVTSGQHQAQVQALSNAGYRMISLSIYGTVGSPRYAAVWVHRAGPAFIPFQDLTAADYQTLVTSNANYAPTIVTAMGSAANPRFAGVLEQTGYTVWALHGLTAQNLSDACKSAHDSGWRIRSADVYNTGGDPRYVVTFQPNPQQVGWGYYTASGVQQHQDKFDALSEAYARPILAAFNDDSSRFLCCWEDTTVSGSGPVHHDMTAVDYDTLANQYWNNDNKYPLNVCASGNGNGARFSAIWATSDLPQARQWTVTGTAVPQLASFDVFVQTLMQNGGVRGAQLAIVKDGKLKYARAYTWAEPGYAPITPTNTFRIASCTKPLTSIAIHRAIQANPMAFDYDTTMVSMFPESQYADPDNSLTTVQHLLRHRGGWDRDHGNGGEPNNYDPMFIDNTIVASNPNLSLPISIGDIRRYMDAQPLDFVPDLAGAGVYSNYGFSQLGRIVERRNPGRTYAQVIDEQIFQPLGLTRPQIGRSRRSQRLPGEVLYHPGTLGVSTCVADSSGDFVPSHYGGWNHENMDSHGAYVMAAVDYAKVLAAFDLGVFNPILHPDQVAAMWTQTPGSGTLQGWFLNNVSDGQGGTIAMREHGGSLPGTRTYIARRADGLSFVLFTNGERELSGVDGEALNNIANMVPVWPAHDLFGSVGIGSFQLIDDIKAPFGGPCPGSTGTPLHVASGSSMIGGRTSFDLSAVRPNCAAFCALGFVPATIDLGPLGAPGCVVSMTPVVSNLVLTGRDGTASYLMDFPLESSYVGAHLLAQWAILDPAANQLGVHVSGGVDARIGGWLSR